MKRSIVADKSVLFGIRVANAYRYLCKNNYKIALFDQFLSSGTAIGALIHEAQQAQSRKDFIHKMNIALKEANETKYWIEILYKSGYINAKSYESIQFDCKELVSMLVKIVKTSKLTDGK